MIDAVRLAPSLDLYAAEPLRVALLGHRGASLAVDGSEVTRLGGLCLQVLISAQKTWAEDGHDFRVGPCSQELKDQLRLFGAADLCADTDSNDAAKASA